MYEIKLINDGIETIINSASTYIEAPRITGSIKQGINTIDSFNFIILPNNQGYSKIHPLKTLVEVVNTKNGSLDFKGRVLLPIPKMDQNGKFYISVICESELGYLMDSTTRYGEYHDISVRDFLNIIIDNHNKQTSKDKHFILGNIEVTGNLYRFMKYEKSFSSIKDNLLDRLGGELKIRYENNIRYLDYLIESGDTKETQIILSKNLKTVEQEKDPTNVISRLAAFGAKLEDSEERISLKTVNNGLDYIDDIDAINTFGVIEDVVMCDDVTLPENLLIKAKEYLQENNKIKKKHKIDALDLSIIGLDVDSFEVGNRYKVINPVMEINEYLRVIEKTIDINNPQNSTLTIGDKFDDIKTYQSNISKTQKSLSSLTQKLTSVASNVMSVNDALQSTNENLLVTTEGLKQTNEAIITTNTVLINTNEKLDRIKKMLIMGV